VRVIPWKNIMLFLLTCLTTLMAGAMMKGIDILSEPWRIWEGFSYSFSIMLILLVHEMGHYFASRFHRVEATLPYFIPVPPFPFIIGTMGAVIKMKSPIMTRRALIDIGASGPIVGFIFSIPVTVVGLLMSRFIPAEEVAARADDFVMSSSLMYSMLVGLVLGPSPEGAVLDMHPVAFAGWIGMFVTMLNLLPVGQLDGGHLLYALLGKWHDKVGAMMIGLLAMMGFIWPGWLIWAVLLLVLGFRHPPVYYWEPRLDNRRRFIAIAAVAVFILTFMPMPFFSAELLNGI